ncbi:MAG: site-specific integrase [Steroidobacteraceae bacterium]|jgi:site-specific recombinase XerD|nr:tyrosine-type recombinase/integrase [Pseudomonadota bacterium]
MLEKYFVRPETADRIRCSWIADSVERYVTWLSAQRYSQSTVKRRIPVAVAFGEFAKSHGAVELPQLPDHVESFAQAWAATHGRGRKPAARAKIVYFARNIVRGMLRQAIPGYIGRGRQRPPENPFERQAPRFLQFLRDEKGLRPASIRQYQFHLRQFAAYIERIGLRDVARVTPLMLSNFIAQYGPRVAWSTVRNACGNLRVFLRYLHREGIMAKDLSPLVEFPQHFRHSGIPRSISWDQVERVLAGIDRRSSSGKRDFAMLGMLATYGLRACEVASLTLDDIDWRNDRIKIRERKAGNTTTYPLATAVGAALIDYIKNARPATTDRHVFFRTLAPFEPIGSAAVTCRATFYIRKAGVQVPRPGSHTLRHSCVQRLVDANFSLKHIGDYVGHRNASSTQIYAKIAVERLRTVALGDGEDVL